MVILMCGSHVHAVKKINYGIIIEEMEKVIVDQLHLGCISACKIELSSKLASCFHTKSLSFDGNVLIRM